MYIHNISVTTIVQLLMLSRYSAASYAITLHN